MLFIISKGGARETVNRKQLRNTIMVGRYQVTRRRSEVRVKGCQSPSLEGILSCFDLSIIQGNYDLIGMNQEGIYQGIEGTEIRYDHKMQ